VPIGLFQARPGGGPSDQAGSGREDVELLATDIPPAQRGRVNVRPERCALVIPWESRRHFRTAVLDCCTMWGGVTNLIIPIKASFKFDALDEYLLRLHQPDRLITYFPTLSATGARRQQRLVRALASHVPDAPIIAADAGGSDVGCHVLNVIHDSDLTSRQLLAHRFVASSAVDELALLSIFGQLYPGQENDYANMTQLGVNPLSLSDLRFWTLQMSADAFSSPVNLTAYGYRAYEVSNGFGLELFELVLGESVEALCYFWNLRATRIATRAFGPDANRVLLGPTRAIADSASLGRLADAIREIGLSPGIESEVDLVVFGAGPDVDRFAQVTGKEPHFRRWRQRFRTSRRFASSNLPPRRSGAIRWATSLPHLPSDFKTGVAFEAAEPMPLHSGTNEIRVVAPGKFVNRELQRTALDFDFEVWNLFPRSPSSARALHADGRWTRQGLSVPSSVGSRPSYISITVPDEFDILRLYFADHGLSIRETKLSSYFDAVVRLVGGFSELDVIATPCAYNVIDGLTARSTKKIAQQLVASQGIEGISADVMEEQLRQAGVVLNLSSYRTADELKTLPSIQPLAGQLLPTLTALASRGAIRRGVALDCVVCATPSLHSIESLAEKVECPGCGHVQTMPAEYPADSGQELRWSYSLNALVNRAWDLDMGPVFASVCRSAVGAEYSSCRGAGIEVLTGSSVIGDLDWTMLRNGRLLAGEAKSGGSLGEKDLRFAERVIAAGIDEFYFCTTSSFTREAIERIQGLAVKIGGDRVKKMERHQLLL
jgi:hypothetical protein